MQHTDAQIKNMEDDLFESIKPLAEQIQQIATESTNLLTPEVEKLITVGSTDPREIERLLDLLLDVAFMPEGLVQFKKLCRYYWELNPVGTGEYIYACRDMWDSK
ncbi:MAG: hypothetical protein KUG82_06505 [Pseudomonadales bacterium]|nr:hypothetical protein [Pseudomonadales bacterium]